MNRPIPAVEKLKAYSPPLEGRHEALRLDFNEQTWPPHPKIESLVKNFPLEYLAVYPEMSKARSAVAKQFQVSPENIQLANGVDEALCNVLRSYLQTEDHVLIPDPGYPMMEFYASLCDAQIVSWDIEEPASPYDLLSAQNKLNTGLKMVIVGQPNNPTGTWLDVEVIKNWCQSYPQTLFVIDEAYVEFGGTSLASEVKNFSNLIVLRTFSKAWGLAGLRLGAVVANQEVVSNLHKMWSPYSVNTLGLYLLENLLPDDKWLESINSLVHQQRSKLRQELEKRKLKTSFGMGNYFLINFGSRAAELVKAFADRGILLRDQSSKNRLNGWVRVSIGENQAMSRFLKVLDEVI